MTESTFTVTYEGTTDRSQNSSIAVEIGDHTLREGIPTEGLSQAEVAQLRDGDEFKYHKFTVEEGSATDAYQKLNRQQLAARGQEFDPPLNLDPEGKKDDLIAAIRAREAEEAAS